MKNVSLVETGLSVSNLAVAKNVVGLIPEPRTRWNVGSLVGAIVTGFTAACHIVITDDEVVAFEAEAALPAALQVSGGSVLTGDLADTAILAIFEAAEGSTKVREVAPFFSPFVASTVSDYGGCLQGLVDAIAQPKIPSYSIASLVSAVISYFEAQESPPPALVVVDQLEGRVYVFEQPASMDAAGFSTAVNSYGSTVFGEKVAAYALTDPAVDPEAPAGPVWG
jgi:hypothetical protein